MNRSHDSDVLTVLWRGRETAQAAQDLLTASSVPDGIVVRVVTSTQAAEAEKDWPRVLVDGNPSETLLSGANLSTVIVPYAGVGETLRRAAVARPHLRVRNSHYNSQMVAQHAAALLLAVANRIIPSDAGLRHGDWGDKGTRTNLGVNLAGKRAVLLGHGSIGRALAPTLTSLGMSLTAFTRSGKAADGLPAVGPDSLHSALSTADVIICSLPATDETIGLVGAVELASLPDRAIVVNVGRGAVIDEDALFAALESGRLYGAGLDVWYRYPEDRHARATTQPSTRPFHTLENVVMSPHRADEVEGWQHHAVADVMLTLEDVRRGGSRNVVDLERGY
ncbi:MAG TPA: NAD(P)-dependent oxidoreductase [Trueperaceae bacterium]|nr:NAD(P)-dependent oxidoreductase [Trueperaceae bacterium]